MVMTVDCVIFDLDGVLVDSDEAWMRVHRDAARKFMSDPPPDEELRELLWATTPEFVDRILPRDVKNREEILEGMCNDIHEHMKALISSSCIKEREGMRDLLRRLRREGKKIGLVTNNDREITEGMLKHFDIQEFFDVIITKDDVGKPKPSPEPIFRALNDLRCAPKDCIYIGDNEEDVIAGKAAGVTTVLLNTSDDKGQAKEKTSPDHTINKLDEVLTLIGLEKTSV